jgi:hypothetical protein
VLLFVYYHLSLNMLRLFHGALYFSAVLMWVLTAAAGDDWKLFWPRRRVLFISHACICGCYEL